MVKDLNDPTNVDSVPAVLTPGEFVLNKEASAMYGPIIEKMNAHGLQQRQAENHVVKANTGMKIQGYNTGGLVASIKEEEGFRDKAYQDPGGVWTIGYGRTTNPDGSKIQSGQTTNRSAEDSWIVGRVDQERAAVKKYGQEKGYDWSDNQVDALASFRYNGGQEMLENLTADGNRDNDTIANKMLLYNKQTIDGKKVPLAGLTKRRQNESALFKGEATPEVEQQTASTEQAPQAGSVEVAPAGDFRDMFADAAGTLAIPALQQGLNRPPPVQHQASRRITQLEGGVPLIGKDQQVRSFNNGGSTWWNPFTWGDDEEEQANTVQQELPIPNSDESLLQFSSESQQQVAALPIGHPDRVAAIESGKFIPTDGDLEWDEQRWRTNEALQRSQLQAAVTAPDAPGAEFINSRVNALTDQLDSLGVPPVSQGVGTDVYVGGPDQPPVMPGQVPNLDANAVGNARPVVDDTVPSPEQVIDNQPQDIWGGMDQILPAPGEEYQSIEQAINTDSPVSVEGRPDLAAPEVQKPNLPNLETATAEQVTNIKENVQTVIDEQGDKPPENVNTVAVEEAGNKAPPQQKKQAEGLLKRVFGDLFNSSELKRAAILMAGGMATGMSPQQALGFAGTNYLGRVDALAASKSKNKQELIKGGKYTTDSIESYMESGDATVLMPTTEGGALEETGQIKDFYSPNGKITGRQVKVGENKVWVDKNNKPINVHKFNEDPSNVRGTPEYRTRINSSMKVVENSLKDLKDQFGVRGEDRDGNKQYATDVLPSVQAGKIAEWAAKNGVRTEEVAGLVESAYHDAINSKRQDGARVRDLTPYLNQLVIRQSVGGSADVFRVNTDGDGPPQYIDTEKMTVLNKTASSILRNKGFKGGSQDLANQFYTAGISDWNKLSPDAKKEWDRKANKGENGFYHYLTNRIDSYL